MWLDAAEHGGQLCGAAAGRGVVLPGTGVPQLPGGQQAAVAEGRGLLPQVLRGAPAEAAADQGTWPSVLQRNLL